ncbi:hypothetical protein NQZ68_039073 [Dissostichus eleginoides]|nr:hypothetical protein NQZ68_039073 [Dissostichus eleginoides]
MDAGQVKNLDGHHGLLVSCPMSLESLITGSAGIGDTEDLQEATGPTGGTLLKWVEEDLTIIGYTFEYVKLIYNAMEPVNS